MAARFRIRKWIGLSTWERCLDNYHWCREGPCIDRKTNHQGLCKAHFIPSLQTKYILEQWKIFFWKEIGRHSSVSEAETQMKGVTESPIVSEWVLLPDQTLEQVN